jgi:hypothetical protein
MFTLLLVSLKLMRLFGSSFILDIDNVLPISKAVTIIEDSLLINYRGNYFYMMS